MKKPEIQGLVRSITEKKRPQEKSDAKPINSSSFFRGGAAGVKRFLYNFLLGCELPSRPRRQVFDPGVMSSMASKTTGNRTTGAPRKSTGPKGAKKTGPQPIPINSGLASHESAVENAPATQAYPGIEEEIRRRAYELYEQRGRHGGSPEADWSRAETEVLSKHQREKSA